MKRLDDFTADTTRAEAMTTITLHAIGRDLETVAEIMDEIAFDTDSIAAFHDKVADIAGSVSELRMDVETHVRATGREWLKDAD